MPDIVQIAFLIPPEIQQGIDAGVLFRYGGVVRDAAGHIVTHLKEVPVKEIEEGANKLLGFVKKNKFIVGTVIIVATTAIAGIVYLVVKDKDNKKVKVPKCVVDFNDSFVSYLNSIRSGSLSEDKIDKVIAALETVTKTQEEGVINIELSPENTSMLIDMIRDYTVQFAAANSYNGQVEAPANASELNSLRHYLNIQKQVFAKCA